MARDANYSESVYDDTNIEVSAHERIAGGYSVRVDATFENNRRVNIMKLGGTKEEIVKTLRSDDVGTSAAMFNEIEVTLNKL